jgi:hypothetical protein
MTQDTAKYYYVIERYNSKAMIRGFLSKGERGAIFHNKNGRRDISNPSDQLLLDELNKWPKINGLCELIEANFKPGQYHPRMMRPVFGVDWIESIVFVDNECCFHFRGVGSLGDKLARFKRFDPVNLDLEQRCLLLWSSFVEITKTVHASGENFNTFGQAIRSSLILACMEVESIFKNCLIRNGYKNKDKYSTKDYVKIKDSLGLARVDLKFMRFPGLQIVSPFQSWSNKEPTKTLIFYQVYNDTKHDSEGKLMHANFGMLVNAMAALVVLFYAQTGRLFTDELQIITHPKFNLLDFYIDPELMFDPSLRRGEGWVESHYFKDAL